MLILAIFCQALASLASMCECLAEVSVKKSDLMPLNLCIQVDYKSRKGYKLFFLIQIYFLNNSDFHYLHKESMNIFPIKSIHLSSYRCLTFKIQNTKVSSAISFQL